MIVGAVEGKVDVEIESVDLDDAENCSACFVLCFCFISPGSLCLGYLVF